MDKKDSRFRLPRRQAGANDILERFVEMPGVLRRSSFGRTRGQKHNYILINKNPRMRGDCTFVEMPGVEPGSENKTIKTSTLMSCLLNFTGNCPTD